MATSTMACQICGYPLAKAVLRAGGDASTPYCRCCAHEDGSPRCRSELIERLMEEAMAEDGLDYFEAIAWATQEVASMSPGPTS